MTLQPVYLKSEGDKGCIVPMPVLKIFKEMERKNASPCIEPSRAFIEPLKTTPKETTLLDFLVGSFGVQNLFFMFIGTSVVVVLRSSVKMVKISSLRRQVMQLASGHGGHMSR
jgi:hypothetical protein